MFDVSRRSRRLTSNRRRGGARPFRDFAARGPVPAAGEVGERTRRASWTTNHSISAKEAPVKTVTRSALALSAFLLLGWSASALGAANHADGFATKTVKYEDLDISRADGAQALYGRIGAAAREVCRAEYYATVRGCRAHAVEQAVQRVGSPLLSSIHRSEVERVEEVVLR